MSNMCKANVVRSFDLKLLRFLQALIDTGSITRAGDAVGLSQPAASQATARLRERLKDPLIVRTGHGWALTPLASQLSAPVRRALAAVEAVFEAASFEPSRSDRRFALASTDYGMSAVVLHLIPVFAREAPLAGLRVDPWSDETIVRLERGEIDAALYADEPIPNDVHYRPLFRDGYALLCRASHPLARSSGPRDALALLDAARAWPHFAPRYPFGRGHVSDNVYARVSLASPQFVVEAPYFYAGAHAVLSADLVTVLPRRIAEMWAREQQMTVLPLDHEALSFEYRVIWHERAHRDPGLAWLRGLIARSTAAPAERRSTLA